MRKIKRQKAKGKNGEEGVIHNLLICLLISFIPLSLFFTFAF